MREYLQELQEMEERVKQMPLLLERVTQVVLLLYYFLLFKYRVRHLQSNIFRRYLKNTFETGIRPF